MSFYCNACGQNPCTGECAKPCEHGIAKREFCDDCFMTDDQAQKPDATPREWWIKEHRSGRNISNKLDLFTAVESLPENPGWVHVIEKSAYDDVIKRLELMNKFSHDHAKERDALAKELEEMKAKHKELISYLPKVPTEPYEKKLARENNHLASEIKRLQNSIDKLRMDSSYAETRADNAKKELAAAKAEINQLVYELDKSRDSHVKVIASQTALLEEMAQALEFYSAATDEEFVGYETFRGWQDGDMGSIANEALAKFEQWKAEK